MGRIRGEVRDQGVEMVWLGVGLGIREVEMGRIRSGVRDQGMEMGRIM